MAQQAGGGPGRRGTARGGAVTRTQTGVFLGALAVVIVALFAPGWVGALLLAAIVGALGSILYRRWPVLPPSRRTLQSLVLLVLAAIATVKALS